MKSLAHLAILWSLLTFAGCASSPVEKIHKVAVHLTMENGSCYGTVVGKNTVLTATHCLSGAKTLAVDGIPVVVYKAYDDKQDHLLLVTSLSFRNAASRGDLPKMGDAVYMIGNPGGLVDIYRQGTVAGSKKFPDLKATLYDLNGFFGDSGAGIFNQDGKLVGVISILYQQVGDGYMKTMGSFDLAFTDAQWEEATSLDVTLQGLASLQK